MKPKTVSIEIHDEVRRERDDLKRENAQLRAAIRNFEMTIMNERRLQSERARRDAQKRATAAIFSGCGND